MRAPRRRTRPPPGTLASRGDAPVPSGEETYNDADAQAAKAAGFHVVRSVKGRKESISTTLPAVNIAAFATLLALSPGTVDFCEQEGHGAKCGFGDSAGICQYTEVGEEHLICADEGREAPILGRSRWIFIFAGVIFSWESEYDCPAACPQGTSSSEWTLFGHWPCNDNLGLPGQVGCNNI